MENKDKRAIGLSCSKFWKECNRRACKKSREGLHTFGTLCLVLFAIIAFGKIADYLSKKGWDMSYWITISPLLAIPCLYAYFVMREAHHLYHVRDKDAKDAESERDRLMTPNLTVSCDTVNDPNCRPPYDLGTNRYFCAVVRTECVNGVKKSSGSFLRIWKEGISEPIWEELKILTYAPAHHPDTLEKTINPGKPFPLDIIYITSSSTVIDGRNWPRNTICILRHPSPEVPLIRGGQTGTPSKSLFHHYGIGKYIFDIVVSGEETKSTEVHLLFDWTGSHSDSQLTKLGDGPYKKPTPYTIGK